MHEQREDAVRGVMRCCAAVALAAVLLPAAAPLVAATADDELRHLANAEWDWRVTQTRGAEWEEGVDTVVPHLPSVDASAQAAKLRRWQDVLRQLDAVPFAQLTAGGQIDYQIYRHQIEVLIERQKHREYEKPLDAAGGFWTTLRGNADQLPLFTTTDYEAYLGQLRDYPRFFRQQIDNMRAGLRRGFTQPRIVVEGRDASIASIAEAKDLRSTPFYQRFVKMPSSIPADVQERLRTDAATVIRDAVVPAHAQLLRFMRKEYVPGARTELGASTLPDGDAYYRARIKEFVTLARDPLEIHQFGLQEVAKIREEMLATRRAAGFSGDFAAFQQFLRTDPQFYARTPAELLARGAVIAKEFDGKVGEYFGRLPRQRFAILPMAADVAPFATGALGGAGYYFLNTYNLPARPLYAMPALTLHESAPGHAFQVPLALENEGLAAFRRKVIIDAYVEGWALYCERLGTEMGMYHDSYETFGMLAYQAFRAARLVVDTGLHARGWTRAQAVEFMRMHTTLNDGEVQTEVDRYIAAPAQALSYYIGAATIWKARRKAEAALGARFDIRAFHDTVLELGAVPLSVLEARVERFIAEGGKGPYAEAGS